MNKNIYILNFSSFNEGLLDNLSSGIKKTLQKSKFSFKKDESNPKLKKWGITFKKISDTNYQFEHNKRIIADLVVEGEEFNKPIFKLTIYFYQSEIDNVESLSLSKRFKDQEEQPYAKGSKKFFNTENAIEFLVSFWSKKTNSGRSKNSDYKIKL